MKPSDGDLDVAADVEEGDALPADLHFLGGSRRQIGELCGGDVNGHDSASLKKDMKITSFSGIPCPEVGKNGGKAEV